MQYDDVRETLAPQYGALIGEARARVVGVAPGPCSKDNYAAVPVIPASFGDILS